MQIQVNSEIGALKRLLIHSPDAGIGKVSPAMKEELLYDDIVYLDKMREEYNEYLLTLLWFLDPETAKKMPPRGTEAYYNFFKPSKGDSYFKSNKVIDIEFLLMEMLKDESIRNSLVSSICALEQCNFLTQHILHDLDPGQLARVIITGVLEEGDKERFLFTPVPNLIFTRDIGITINDHILLSKPAEKARSRESIITQYIVNYMLLEGKFEFSPEEFSNRVVEIEYDKLYFLSGHGDDEKSVSIEGGDVMMISPRHVLIGHSVRTTAYAIDKTIKELFKRNIADKVTVISIPRKRDYMHIDTVFTIIKRNMWVMFEPFSGNGNQRLKKSKVLSSLVEEENQPLVSIHQFVRENTAVKKFKCLEDLFYDISVNELGAHKDEFKVIYCADGEFPYGEREQWTDACNFLCLKEGVIIGYDRNTIMADQLSQSGFKLIKTSDFIEAMAQGQAIETLIDGDTLLLLPSSELSRARGGTHCMSMPLLRENWN